MVIPHALLYEGDELEPEMRSNNGRQYPRIRSQRITPIRYVLRACTKTLLPELLSSERLYLLLRVGANATCEMST